MSRRRWIGPGPALLLAVTLGACASDSGGGDGSGPERDAASTASDGGLVSAAADDAALGVASAGPQLDACERACNRVVDCAVDGCKGVDWRVAALADTDCRAVCNPALSSSVMDAATCSDVLAIATPASTGLNALCNAPICDAACGRFADCTIEGCSGLDESSRMKLESDCRMYCDDDSAGDFLGTECSLLVESLRKDPAFAAQCEFGTGCPKPAVCPAYAAQVRSCLDAQCSADLSGYDDALEELFDNNCRDPAECPTAGEAALLTDADTTCVSAGLSALGTQAPFAMLCSGKAAPAAQVQTLCEGMQTCAFFADFKTVGRCVAMIGLSEQSVVLADCLDAAADCNAMGTCFASQP